MKVIILDKVESLHMYKNIFGKHVIEVRTISGKNNKNKQQFRNRSFRKIQYYKITF